MCSRLVAAVLIAVAAVEAKPVTVEVRSGGSTGLVRKERRQPHRTRQAVDSKSSDLNADKSLEAVGTAASRVAASSSPVSGRWSRGQACVDSARGDTGFTVQGEGASCPELSAGGFCSHGAHGADVSDRCPLACGVCEPDVEWTNAVRLTSVGNDVESNVAREAFNDLFRACPVVRYVRNGRVHSVYVRLSPVASVDAFHLFTDTWTSESNELGLDFQIYDSLREARLDEGAWAFCDYDEPGVGYPRDCGRQGPVGMQWFAMPGGHDSAGELTNGASLEIFSGRDCPSPLARSPSTDPVHIIALLPSDPASVGSQDCAQLVHSNSGCGNWGSHSHSVVEAAQGDLGECYRRCRAQSWCTSFLLSSGEQGAPQCALAGPEPCASEGGAAGWTFHSMDRTCLAAAGEDGLPVDPNPVPPPVRCADDPPGWTSSSGLTCEMYAGEHYCTPSGGYGANWQASWGTFDTYALAGRTAASACCACGGGVRTDAAGSDSTSPAAAAATAAHFEMVDGGMNRACRGAGAFDDQARYYTAYGSIGALQRCQELCMSEISPVCVGIDYNGSRCQLWHRVQGIGATEYALGHQCYRYPVGEAAAASGAGTGASDNCADASSTPVSIRGGQLETCAALSGYCADVGPIGREVRHSCMRSCGLCGVPSCEDMRTMDPPILASAGRPASCGQLLSLCTGTTAEAPIVRHKCQRTCGLCPPSTAGEHTRRWGQVGQHGRSAEMTGCSRRRRWGFCVTRRRDTVEARAGAPRQPRQPHEEEEDEDEAGDDHDDVSEEDGHEAHQAQRHEPASELMSETSEGLPVQVAHHSVNQTSF